MSGVSVFLFANWLLHLHLIGWYGHLAAILSATGEKIRGAIANILRKDFLPILNFYSRRVAYIASVIKNI